MIIDPESELQPIKIIQQNQEKENKAKFVKAVFLDVFFVFYSIIVVQRAIYYKFIL